jgi:hypothetical protein
MKLVSCSTTDIGPLWAKHFPRIGDDVVSKTRILTLVYLTRYVRKLLAGLGDGTGQRLELLADYVLSAAFRSHKGLSGTRESLSPTPLKSISSGGRDSFYDFLH